MVTWRGGGERKDGLSVIFPDLKNFYFTLFLLKLGLFALWLILSLIYLS